MTDIRDAILAAARATLGASGPEPWATEAGVRGGVKPDVEWCGLWVRAIWRRAGLVVPDWITGSANLKPLTKITTPQPGDLIQWRGKAGHQSIFVGFDGPIVRSVDGNSTGRGPDGKPVYEVVAEKRRASADVLAYYSAPLASATPRPVPVDTRASTGAGLPSARLLGVDVSAHQTPGSMNWRLLRELGFSFAYVRGVKMGRELDVHAVEHVARAREAGFAVGLYAFFDPRHEATKQLCLAIDAHAACGLHPGDLAPTLDVESITGGPTAIPAWSEPAHFILRGLRDEYGDVLRYHNVRDWFLMGRPSQLEGFDLWLADYAPPADLPCVCWQHKSATIPGYGSQVLDQNVAMGPLPTIGGRAVPVVVEPSTLPDEIALPWVRWDHAEHSRLRNLAEQRKTDRGEYD
jgi:hypothetical protein